MSEVLLFVGKDSGDMRKFGYYSIVKSLFLSYLLLFIATLICSDQRRASIGVVWMSRLNSYASINTLYTYLIRLGWEAPPYSLPTPYIEAIDNLQDYLCCPIRINPGISTFYNDTISIFMFLLFFLFRYRLTFLWPNDACNDACECYTMLDVTGYKNM